MSESTIRTWSYNARLVEGEPALLKAAVSHIKKVAAKCGSLPSKDAYRVAREMLAPYWWPNIDYATGFSYLCRRGFKIPNPYKNGGVAVFRLADRGTLGEVLSKSRQVIVRKVDDKHLDITIPLLTDFDPLTLRLTIHRPLPIEFHFVRGYISCTTDNLGKLHCRVNFMMRMPKAEIRQEGDVLGIDLGWRRIDQNYLAATIYCEGKGFEQILLPYHRGMDIDSSQKLKDRFRNYRLDHYRKSVHRVLKGVREIKLEYIDWRKNFQAKHGIRSKNIVAPGLLERTFRDIAELLGITVTDVLAPYTTTTCSACTYAIPPARSKGYRFITCPNCETEHDQDENASKNIARARDYIRSGTRARQ